MIVVAAGLALRVAYALWKGDQAVIGDAAFYRFQSQALADGHGFLAPGAFYFGHTVILSAEHPPLYTLYLTVAQLLGITDATGLRLWSALLGVPTILATIAAGRALAGDRVGLLAGGLAAVSPLLVMTDGLVMSESITATAVALSVWLAARAFRDPTRSTVAWFGAAAGLAALARAELVLLLPIVLGALAVRRAGGSVRHRLALVGIGLAVASLVMAPWVVRNLTTFERPVLLSDGWDITTIGANCPTTYSGPLIGLNDITCGKRLKEGRDQSVTFARARTIGLRYARDHLDRLPAVAFARLGRTFGFFNARQQVGFDYYLERRERPISYAGFAVWWLSVGFGIHGLVVLHRRKVSTVPILAPVAAVAIAVVVTYGNTRLRIPADVSVLIAAAVSVGALLDRARNRSIGTAASTSSAISSGILSRTKP